MSAKKRVGPAASTTGPARQRTVHPMPLWDSPTNATRLQDPLTSVSQDSAETYGWHPVVGIEPCGFDRRILERLGVENMAGFTERWQSRRSLGKHTQQPCAGDLESSCVRASVSEDNSTPTRRCTKALWAQGNVGRVERSNSTLDPLRTLLPDSLTHSAGIAKFSRAISGDGK